MASPSRKPATERSIAWPVSISQAAQAAGISARMARHYESLNLLPHVHRTDSGYRLYTQSDVHTLSFIRRCRDLGFSMEEIENLLNLWHDKQRASRLGQGDCAKAYRRLARAHCRDEGDGALAAGAGAQLPRRPAPGLPYSRQPVRPACRP